MATRFTTSEILITRIFDYSVYCFFESYDGETKSERVKINSFSMDKDKVLIVQDERSNIEMDRYNFSLLVTEGSVCARTDAGVYHFFLGC